MKYKFVDRERELQFLEEQVAQKEGKFIILYGRRRVGKTELLNRFLRNKNAFYFLADTSSRFDQIRSFTKLLAKHLKDDFLLKQPLGSWDAVFSYLSKLNKQLIIAIDEFPYLVREDASLQSIIQKYWDLRLRKNNFTLILSGSSVSFMENQVLSIKSPLYGRRTGDWHLKPLRFKDMKGFYPNLSNEEMARVYALFGGIPFYLNRWDSEIPFEKQLIKIIRKGTVFYNEPYFLVKEELSDPSNYFAVLKAIAKGERTLGKICAESGIETNSITKYLSVLENLNFVEREVRVTDSSLRKRGLYKISDPFLRFWFRYIFPNKTALEQGRERELTKEILRDLNNFMGIVFEDIAKELLYENFPEIQKLGRWWDKEIEIDGIGTTNKEMIFAEFKWSSLSKKNIEQIYHQLLEKSSHIRTTKKKRYVVICKKAETKAFSEVKVFDLEDF